MSDVAERVKKIVVEHLGVEAEKVTDNASFIDDLGADSLDTVELVMAFEEEFGCEIPDDAAEHILTVGKQLTNELYFGYEYGITSASQSAKLVYQLTRSIQAIGRVGTESWGGELKYTIRFD